MQAQTITKNTIRCEDGTVLTFVCCDSCDFPIVRDRYHATPENNGGEGYFHAHGCPEPSDPAPEWHGLERSDIGDDDALLDSVRKCDVGGLYHPVAEVPDVECTEIRADGSRYECEVPICVHCLYRIEHGLPLEKKCW